MWSSSYLEIGSPRVGLVNFREASVRLVGRRDEGVDAVGRASGCDLNRLARGRRLGRWECTIRSVY